MIAPQMAAPGLAGPLSHRALPPVPVWPILMICFFAISSGSVSLFGLPQTIVLSLLISAGMLVMLRFHINKTALTFTAALILGLLPGTVLSLLRGNIELLSFINLISSLCIFSIVFSYTSRFLLTIEPHSADRIFSRILIGFIILSVVEIYFYDAFFDLRNAFYRGNIADQELRDTLLYGIVRPTGLFTEPSNFARTLSLLLALLIVGSGRISARTIVIVSIFLLLIRSPIIFYALPALLPLFMLYVEGRKSRILTGIFGISLILALFVFLQGDRVADVLSGEDGSFNGRVLLPLQYLVYSWDHPFFGSGAMALGEINDVINALYIAQDRPWLIGTEFSLALSPALVIFVAMGSLGAVLFIIAAAVLSGLRIGLSMVACFFALNMLGAGFNAPAMYVPCAIALAVLVHSLKNGQLQPRIPA